MEGLNPLKLGAVGRTEGTSWIPGPRPSGEDCQPGATAGTFRSFTAMAVKVQGDFLWRRWGEFSFSDAVLAFRDGRSMRAETQKCPAVTLGQLGHIGISVLKGQSGSCPTRDA